jgi:hypothetical protein
MDIYRISCATWVLTSFLILYQQMQPELLCQLKNPLIDPSFMYPMALNFPLNTSRSYEMLQVLGRKMALKIDHANFNLIVVQETSARLLFMAVRWVRWLAPFQTLSRADQLLLLQESWKELFLLYLAQWSAPWDIDAVLTQRLARHRLTDDLLINTEVKTIQVTISPTYSQFSAPSVR